MQRTPLPQDLAALVHHVELSRAGWRERAIRHLLLATISRHSHGLSPDDVCESANQALPGPLAPAEISRHLDSLKSKGSIIRLPNGHLKLSEHARLEIEKQLASAESRRATVRDEFDTAFSYLPPRIEISWDDFLESFLTPLVAELGAKTYHILTGQDPRIEDTTSYLEFLKRFPEDDRVLVYQTISRFVDSTSPAVRMYILRLLNTAFLVRALTLPAGAVQELLRRTRRRLQMRVFVDTNFLFSLLGLHVNPADDVVRALHELIESMPNRVDVKLYMLPCTMDEARETIARYQDRLSSFYLSRQIADAIRQGQINLSGISATYVQEAYDDGRRISARDYFAPYLKDFIGVARSKGVEIFNVSLDAWRMNQNVIDDVAEQMEWEQNRRHGRGKSYETLLHDMMLWHFARGQRPGRIDSPLDARAWVATVDYGLLRFDAFKRRGFPQEPAVCLHPTVLLQILQFWVPNSESLEAALMTSLRPVTSAFDSEAEKITVKIISSLSRFETIDDLSVETITNVVLSDAVRGRITRAKNAEEELAAVQTGVIEESRLMKMRAERYRKDASGLRDAVKQRDTKIARLEKEIEIAVEKRNIADTELRVEKASNSRLETQLCKVQDDFAALTGDVRTTKLLRQIYFSATAWGVGIAIVGSGVAVALLVALREIIVSVPERASAITIGIILAVAIGTEKTHRVLRRVEIAGASPVPGWLTKCKKWCWRVLTALVVAGLATGLFG